MLNNKTTTVFTNKVATAYEKHNAVGVNSAWQTSNIVPSHYLQESANYEESPYFEYNVKITY